MWRHIEFKNGANAYISMTDDNFAKCVFAYNLEAEKISPGVSYFTAGGYNPAKTYTERKNRLEDLAIEYSHAAGNGCESWEDVAEWQAFFRYYGRRYGLMRVFRENAIC